MNLGQQFEKKNQSIVIHLIGFLVKHLFFLVNKHLIIGFTSKYTHSFSQFILILSLVLSSFSSFGQKVLNNDIQAKKKDLVEILDRAWDFNQTKPDSMYLLDYQALRLAKKFDFLSIQGTAHSQLAFYFNQAGIYDSAIFHYFKGIEIYESVDSLRKKLINNYYNLAFLYDGIEFHKEAMESILKSKNIALEFNEFEHVPFVYFSQAKLFDEEIFPDSVSFYYKLTLKTLDTLTIKKTSPSEINDLILGTNANLCFFYLRFNLVDSAKIYLDKYDDYFRELDSNNPFYKMNLAFQNHKYFMAIKDFNNSFKQLRKVLKYAKELKFLDQEIMVYESFKDYYVATNQYDSAFYYSNRANFIQDSLESADVIRMVAEAETKYETAEKEKKILKLETSAKLTKSRNLLLSALSIAFALIIITVSIFYSLNRKKSKKLAKQNVIIQESYTEIENLIRESHHRIKNNLQVVSSLLKMQSKNVNSDEAKSSLMEAFNRVKTIALLHQRLQGSKSFKQIKVKDFIVQLTGNIKHSLTNEDSKIELTTNLVDIEIETDDTISIGLIINELITNSIKYAFPTKEGLIEVNLKEVENDLVLEVKDNGIGLPENFDPFSGKSLGFKIVKSLATKLKAELSVRNENGAIIEIKMKAS